MSPIVAPVIPSIKSLLRGSTLGAVGFAVFGLSQYLVLIVIARYLSVQQAGAYSLASAAITPFFAMTNLSLRAGIATDISSCDRLPSFLLARAICSGVAVALLIPFLVAGVIGPLELATPMLIWRLLDSIIDILYGDMQKHYRMSGVALSLMLRSALMIVLSRCIMVFSPSTTSLVLVNVLITLLILLIHDIPAVVGHRPAGRSGDSNRFSLRQIIRKSNFADRLKDSTRIIIQFLPLGACTFFLSVHANAPRYFIASYLTTAALGEFALLAGFGAVFLQLFSAVGQSFSPVFAMLYGRGDIRRLKQHLATAAQLILLGSILGGGLYATLWPKAYFLLTCQASTLTAIQLFCFGLAVGMSCLASFYGFVATATRSLLGQTFLVAFVAFSGLASYSVFVPAYGMNGVCVGMCLGSALMAVGYFTITSLSLSYEA